MSVVFVIVFVARVRKLPFFSPGLSFGIECPEIGRRVIPPYVLEVIVAVVPEADITVFVRGKGDRIFR